MELGVVSAIYHQSDFKQMIELVAGNDLSCVEVACWPKEKPDRRYAGVCHISTDEIDDRAAEEIRAFTSQHDVRISALAYYPNPLDEDPSRRKKAIDHLLTVIDAAQLLDINLVTTFIGRMQHASASENFTEVGHVWKPILNYAQDRGVRIAIENCPMLFTETEWPGGQNIMTSPSNWERIFNILDSDWLGINYDPSHFLWQQIDYLAPIQQFKDKIFHVHIKDIKLLPQKLASVGILALPLEYMLPKLPGLGEIDWGAFVSGLTDIGYRGAACIEVEDRAFESSYEEIKKSVTLSARYMRNYII
ncbi:Xylose isomerase domain-containing protein TIM barrel [Coriobacterium glomerans PW2]|uniref:Xylose isomerase domain-containing protein TIM barrel n=1 Tax=Coriobacterium glomerans (strain ATCC 49209 / DSM 20642 / JCM 10262 / PW2) TaxID=700015 RepID=F2NB51_CORGP|nr:sugar phosphate isomerase/epimerase [Coriobacterium glomerans]AEB07802.1 Xylose isomerase domain-containing protein TIM barrel [Coriobacterium glomerans PW2]